MRRDVFRGRVWSAHALRTVRDTGEALVACSWPGAETRVGTTYAAALRTGDDALRKQTLPELASGRWQLGRRFWQDTVLLVWRPPQGYFSVNAFYAPGGDHPRLLTWYVNFERPPRRTAVGYDTLDLLVDLVVAPDLSRRRWKDEDEYAQGRRLGIVGKADHRAVEVARGRALAMIEAREGPFGADAGWADWRPDPAWPVPRLPAGALVPGPQGS